MQGSYDLCFPITAIVSLYHPVSGMKDRTSSSSDHFGNGSLIIASLLCKQELEIHTFMSVLGGPEMYQAQAVACSSHLANIC